jgi:hypothetical protein
VVGLAACGDDKKTDVNSVVEDGFFVVGEASGYTSPDNKARLASGKNEETKVAREGMYDGYVWLEKGQPFNMVEVTASVAGSTFGGTLVTKDANSNGDQEPQVAWYEGNFVANGAAYTLPADAQNGLYHIIADKTTQKMVAIPVTYWAMPGDAIAGWNDCQKMNIVGTPTKDRVEYKTTIVPIKGTGYQFKFRHSGAWKVTLDGTEGSAVRGFTNFGGTIDNLSVGQGPEGNPDNNILSSELFKGEYAFVSLIWTSTDGFQVSLGEKSQLGNANYSNVKFGVRGQPSPLDWAAEPTVEATRSGDVYTWSVVCALSAGDNFKLYGGTDGADGCGAEFWLGVGDVSSAANYDTYFGGTDNIEVKTGQGGNYTFTISIDAANNDAKTITIVKNN